ncbi:hypothetical protein SAMN05216358_0035 [Rhizobium sp. AN5]|uniref:hypothetical protein n=1 Tax=Rhizobium sp. AN5 TaxID=1855304 RepID=UPI000BDC5D01|nr:hypothetical protein [Rhizobium sp. AN5]SOC90019.1 hypothetical protein SAMN05216358_0035 [Rhizobium sp. AN5]
MNVNPIHFFNERGHSILSADYLHAENRRLQEEVWELERKVRSLSMRLSMLASDDDEEQLFA